jgi:hypothetical protein
VDGRDWPRLAISLGGAGSASIRFCPASPMLKSRSAAEENMRGCWRFPDSLRHNRDMSGLQSGYGGGMSRYGAESHAQLKHGRTPR